MTITEHARLKDHVSGMDGGLEAKVHEGYVCTLFTLPRTFIKFNHIFKSERHILEALGFTS